MRLMIPRHSKMLFVVAYGDDNHYLNIKKEEEAEIACIGELMHLTASHYLSMLCKVGCFQFW